MKTWWKKFLCKILKRHTIARCLREKVTTHEIYGLNGGGLLCTCPYCGDKLIFRRSVVRTYAAKTV
jgi:hypothetical protein